MTASVLVFAATGCGSGGGTAPIAPLFGAVASPSVPVILPTPIPSASATPSPSPSASPTASPTPSPSPTPVNTAYEFVVVSRDANCNFSETKLQKGQVTGGVYGIAPPSTAYDFVGSVVSSIVNGYVPNDGDVFYLRFGLRSSVNGLAPGRFTFPQNPSSDNFQNFNRTEIEAQINATTRGYWAVRGGDLIIEAVSGNTVTFSGENVRFVPVGRTAVGSFTVNFRLTVTYETRINGGI